MGPLTPGVLTRLAPVHCRTGGQLGGERVRRSYRAVSLIENDDGSPAWRRHCVVTLPAGRGRPLGLAAPAPGPHRPGASNSVAGSTALLRIATCHGESPGYTCHARVGTLEQGTSEFDPFGLALSWKHVGASLRGTTTHCKVHVTPWRWRHQPTRHRSMRREPVSIQEDDKNRVLPLAHYQSLSVRLALY
jgi:hypothetical protein